MDRAHDSDPKEYKRHGNVDRIANAEQHDSMFSSARTLAVDKTQQGVFTRQPPIVSKGSELSESSLLLDALAGQCAERSVR